MRWCEFSVCVELVYISVCSFLDDHDFATLTTSLLLIGWWTSIRREGVRIGPLTYGDKV